MLFKFESVFHCQFVSYFGFFHVSDIFCDENWYVETTNASVSGLDPEYTEENPKMVTKCEHHFHLCCILEWLERSDSCPVCDQVSSLSPSYLVVFVFGLESCQVQSYNNGGY